MQEELNKFERLEVWDLIPRLDKVMVITLKWIYKVKLDELGGKPVDTAGSGATTSAIGAMTLGVGGSTLGGGISQSPKGIFINKSKYALESLKKYGFESCDPVDTPMVKKSKLDEDKEGKAVDPSHYHGSAYRKALTCGQKDLLIPMRNRQSRERIEFLINKLGMRSYMPETLKQLTDKVDE
nr:hypothetical protein [Tanacetum cinerariifolium]